MTSAELIKDIEANKHNIKMRLRMAVLDPIDSIINDSYVTTEFSLEQKEKAGEIYNTAASIMAFFSVKWFESDDDPEEAKLASLRKNIRKATNEIIPQIKGTIIPFYDTCYHHPYYFRPPLANNETFNLIQDSLKEYEAICEGLGSLERVEEESHSNYSEVNLLEILQKGLDKTPVAIVSYDNEYRMSAYNVRIDKEKFLNDVLLNIRSNIERHAFGALQYKKKLITEKQVLVSVEPENQDFHIVNIQNNGAPFKGDIGQVFDYGYTSGKSGNEGKGMFSIKKTMKEFGGDVQFISNDGHVTYKLFIRK